MAQFEARINNFDFLPEIKIFIIDAIFIFS